MPFQRGTSGNPRGKPKGALNKTTTAAKTAIEAAAQKIGGVDRLVAWVREAPANERIFWGQIYPKLLPLQVSGDPEQPLIPPGTSVRFIVAVDPEARNRT